jgi:hypothetical protein
MAQAAHGALPMEWIRENHALMWWMTGVSVAMAVGTLLLVPVVVVRIPADYFKSGKRSAMGWEKTHPAAAMAFKVLKNVVGWVMIALGIAMLVLPGQGLLTIFLGVLLVDYPGKFRFERWLVTRPRILRVINAARKKRGAEELSV